MFAEGSLPERYSLVKKKDPSFVRCSPKAAPRSATPRLKKKGPFFGEVFAEGSPPERNSLVLKKGTIFGEVFAEGSPPRSVTPRF